VGHLLQPDLNFGGVQGGGVPYVVDRPLDEIAVDPYGPASRDFVVGNDSPGCGARRSPTATSASKEKRELFDDEPSGGLGCFTPDSFPVFDVFSENAYFIADSNHGYKMIGVGELVARDAGRWKEPLLEPFRFGRYAAGRLHPVSHSPYRGAEWAPSPVNYSVCPWM